MSDIFVYLIYVLAFDWSIDFIKINSRWREVTVRLDSGEKTLHCSLISPTHPPLNCVCLFIIFLFSMCVYIYVLLLDILELDYLNCCLTVFIMRRFCGILMLN